MTDLSFKQWGLPTPRRCEKTVKSTVCREVLVEYSSLYDSVIYNVQSTLYVGLKSFNFTLLSTQYLEFSTLCRKKRLQGRNDILSGPW